MKSLRKLIPTDIRDSYQVLQELQALGPLPPGAKLFTADAVSMYTNISTLHSIEVIGKLLAECKDEIPLDFPTSLFLKVLELVMSGNIFQFDDLFFRQEDGTAMGTSCAMLYACLYYGYHEWMNLIPKYHPELAYDCQFVDDKLGIWTSLAFGLEHKKNLKNTNLIFLLVNWSGLCLISVIPLCSLIWKCQLSMVRLLLIHTRNLSISTCTFRHLLLTLPEYLRVLSSEMSVDTRSRIQILKIIRTKSRNLLQG